jgi:exosortase
MNSDVKTDRTWQEDLRQMIPGPGVLASLGCLAAAFCWSYWKVGSFSVLGRAWSQADYQHGPLVPLFSLFLLWIRRDMVIPFTGRGSWWGLVFLAIWAWMGLAAVYFNFGSLPEMSMIPFFAGLALFVGGWRVLRWAWPAIVFLAFMLPLPGDIQAGLSLQLQDIATRASVFIIQTLGISSIAIGHVICFTGDRKLEVAQACSGLRMMMMFFALCIGAAFLIKKPLWEKLVIIASAIPIAILGNVARIVVTAVCLEIARRWPSLMNSETIEQSIHDVAGWVIEMPCGMLLLWLELTLLSKLLIPPLAEKPLMLSTLAAEQAPSGNSRRDRQDRRD